MAKSVVKPPAKWCFSVIFRPNDGDFGVISWGYSATWTSNHQEDDDQPMNSCKMEVLTQKQWEHHEEKNTKAIQVLAATILVRKVRMPSFWSLLVLCIFRSIQNWSPSYRDVCQILDPQTSQSSSLETISIYLQFWCCKELIQRQVENSSFNPRVSLWSSPQEKNLHNHSV